MPRPPRRPPPQVLTLAGLGARDLPLHVGRIPSQSLPRSHEPVIATFALFFLATAGRGQGRHLEQVDVRPGDLHFVPAGVEIHPLNVGALEGWLVAFDPTLPRSLGMDLLARAPDAKGAPRPALVSSLAVRGLLRLRLGRARRRRVERLIVEMDAELRDRQWGCESAARALFALLLTELLREAREQAPKIPPLAGSLVRDVLAYLEANSLSPISLHDVAAAVGRTPSYVATAVRQETGLTVGDWLREHRMAEARRRLLETAASVEAIAGQVGYADVTSFVRGFRRAHGLTPRAWREQHRHEGA